MTYDDAVKKINSLLVFGSKPGLERVSELVERIGSPDKKLKFVHVAGTNGKGSVCASVASVLTKAGYKTGLFISPFVIEFRERFQINGRMIPKETLAGIVEDIFPVVEQMKNEGKIITEFELVLAAALRWYAMENCDVVVLETGLGGRFDATNIIDTPLVSVIMSISLDHTAILGDTCEKIAFEKCGIIKPDGVTVLYGEQPEGVYDVVKSAADERRNKLITAKPDSVTKLGSGLRGSRFAYNDGVNGPIELTTPLIGDHQLKNNPGGAAALSSAVKEHLSDRKKVAVAGMLADKDVRNALSMLVPLFDYVIAVQPDNPRAMSAEELCGIVMEYGVPAEVCRDHAQACKKALRLAGEFSDADRKAAVVIFGSLYLASDIRRIMLGLKGNDKNVQ